MAANRFTGTTNGNTNTSTNWSTGSVPLAADGNVATFDALSPNATVNAALACNAIDFTGYTATITWTNGITVSGDITLGASMNFSGSGTLTVAATCNLRSNAKIFPQPLTFSAASTMTLLDEWIVTGLLTPFNSAATRTFNGFAFRVRGNLTTSNASNAAVALGTTQIIFDNPSGAGSSTVTAAGGGTGSSSGGLRLSVTINTAGTVVFSGSNLLQTATITYTAGTVTTTGSTLFVNGTTTLNTAGVIWANVMLVTAGSATITFTSDFTLTGTLTVGSTTATVTLNGFTIHAKGSIAQASTSGTVTGTTLVIIEDTCTLSQSSITTGSFRTNIQFNAPGKTITLGTTFRHGSAVGRTITAIANTTLAGSFGLDVDNLTINAGVTVTVPSSITQRVRLAFRCNGVSGSAVALQAATPSTSANLTLDVGAGQSVRFTNATDIDSSGGQRIRDRRGTLTRTTNWINRTDVPVTD